MKKTIRVGTVKCGGSWASVYCKIEISEDGRLSISGVIGPMRDGDSIGGCGQIDTEFDHKDKSQNDKQYDYPVQAEDMHFAPGWDAEKWYKFLDVWHCWHLNNMRAGCEHQRKLGWEYEEHHDPKTFEGEACPECGYHIGSAWLKEELPQEVIEFLAGLPETDKQPAWV